MQRDPPYSLFQVTGVAGFYGEFNPVNAKLLAVRRWQFSLLDQDAMGHSPSSFYILPTTVDLLEFERFSSGNSKAIVEAKWSG